MSSTGFAFSPSDATPHATLFSSYDQQTVDTHVSGRQRAHGDFMWRQFYNMVRAGAQGIYISMFDEYGEGNQIAKTAENASMSPVGAGLFTLDEDGTACSSDCYLRLTADGGRMLKGQLPLTATRPTPPTLTTGGSIDLARGRATAESSHIQNYGAGNAVDGNADSYWESANNVFPQWLQVDLGAATAVTRIVVALPPSSAWGTRTQTLALSGSADGTAFDTLVPATGYVFDPARGNSVTITVPRGGRHFLRLTCTGNTGRPAGQIARFEVYS